MASIIKVDQIQESTTGVGTNFPNIVYLDDDTTANTPVLSFIGDTNTGISRSAADTLDLITAGNSRFRIEPTGQIKATYESTVGTDYNTTLHNGYFCRAWVNFDGTGTVAIRASGNVSSITDNGNGDYTVNFTTAMPDINYCTTGATELDSSPYAIIFAPNRIGTTGGESVPTTISVRINSVNQYNYTAGDTKYIFVAVFR